MNVNICRIVVERQDSGFQSGTPYVLRKRFLLGDGRQCAASNDQSPTEVHFWL
jgi:hypothetical protein